MKLTTDILEQMILEELEEGLGDYLKKNLSSSSLERFLHKGEKSFKDRLPAEALKYLEARLQRQQAEWEAEQERAERDEHPMQKQKPKPFTQTRLVPKNKL